MIRGTFVLFTRVTNGQKFSEDCLKDIVKDLKGKEISIANHTGVAKNFRYIDGVVIGEYLLPKLALVTSGTILSNVSLPNEKHGLVTQFKVNNIQLIQKK